VPNQYTRLEVVLSDYNWLESIGHRDAETLALNYPFWTRAMRSTIFLPLKNAVSRGIKV
jgi:hypothetical protein